MGFLPCPFSDSGSLREDPGSHPRGGPESLAGSVHPTDGGGTERCPEREGPPLKTVRVPKLTKQFRVKNLQSTNHHNTTHFRGAPR